uniref:Uncharacterized protein n=1 Tax=Arundo donax TaxID=35708 RepID=A0A0A9AS28_ARUDO
MLVQLKGVGVLFWGVNKQIQH